MSIISDSSQEASNAAMSSNLTPVSSPNLFNKSELPDLQQANVFKGTSGLLKPGSSACEQAQKRRSSSRSIKRKKFDDELVESSLIKSSRPKPQNIAFPLLSAAVSLSSPSVIPSSSAITAETQTQPDVSAVLSAEKRKSRPSQKRVKKQKSYQSHVSKKVSRWKPTDDMMLILSVQQTNDLEAVYRGVKFSSTFSLRDLQSRWYSLLYDASISKPAVYAIKQLSPEVKSQIKEKSLFSKEEETLIAAISSDKGNIEVFQELLDANASVFLQSRTAKALLIHWTKMKQYYLLQDQQVLKDSFPAGDTLPTLSDAEEMWEDCDLRDPKDSVLDEEVINITQKLSQEVKLYENEVSKWQALVDPIIGVSSSEFKDSKTLAVLRGRVVRYLIQSQEVTFGRCTKDNTVDIDFTLEGPAMEISRRQGAIKMDKNGDFFLINEAKKSMIIDGKPVLSGTKYKLRNNSVIYIAALRFIFLVNQEVISALKAKT